MKMMTCAQMGGPCDAKITGATAEEMRMNGMQHLEETHPEMAADVQRAAPTDPMIAQWDEDFKKKFEAAPEM